MYSLISRKALIGLAFSLIFSNSLMAEQRFYPTASQTRMAVGTEEFQENYASLAGLEGVHVVTRYVSNSAKKYQLTDMKTDLDAQIKKRLNAAGLRLLNKKELATTPGQPSLTFYPAYTGIEIEAAMNGATASVEMRDENSNELDSSYCRSSIWASFLQSATILRDPNRQYKFITWGSGDNINDCENRGAWTYDAVLKVVDKFVADYKKAERENEIKSNLKPVNNANEVPEDCTQSWTLTLPVFEFNQVRLRDPIKPILDALSRISARCKRYRYIIETHSNSHADTNYNRILSEARAHAIKDYLLHQNVSFDRLETAAFGQKKSPKIDTSNSDRAPDHRVVITPQL